MIRRFVTSLRSALPDLQDVFVLGGIGLASYGAWQVYPPAGFMTAGVALAALGLLGARS